MGDGQQVGEVAEVLHTRLRDLENSSFSPLSVGTKRQKRICKPVATKSPPPRPDYSQRTGTIDDVPFFLLSVISKYI